MDIKDNRVVSYVDFEDLEVGDVFYEVGSDDIFFMKTEGYAPINAINLERGLLVEFDDCSEVVKVKATLTIE